MYSVVKSGPTLCVPTDLTHQAPLSTEFSKQEYWSGLPFPSPGDLPKPRIEPTSPALQADSLPYEHQEASYWKDAEFLWTPRQLCD